VCTYVREVHYSKNKVNTKSYKFNSFNNLFDITKITHYIIHENTGGFMKVVDSEFTKYGDFFRLVRRERNLAIYERKSILGTLAWETVRIRKQSCDKECFGNIVAYAGDEYLPTNEEFGTHGWYCTTFEAAEKKFNDLLKEIEANGN